MSEKCILVGAALFNWSETQRMTEISDELVKRGYKVVFVGSGKFDFWLENKNYIREQVDYDSEWYTPKRISMMLDMDKYGGNFARSDEVDKIIESEIKVIEKYKPAAILTGYRMTLTVSARVCEIPVVWCLSAAVSKPYLEMTLEKTKLLSAKKRERDSGQAYETKRAMFEDRVACQRLLGACKTSKIWNDYLVKNGKEPFDCDLDLYTGDLHLMSDAREFFPELEETQRYKFIGPILNNLHIPMPEVVNEVLNNGNKRKKVLISVGSSGNKELFLKILRSCLDFDCDYFISVIGILSDEEKNGFPENYHFCEKFPLIEIAKLCDGAIIQGGQGTLYAAIAAKCPILSIPATFEQRKNIENLFEHYRCGEFIRMFGVSEESIKAAFSKLLISDEYKKEMTRASNDIGKYFDNRCLAAEISADYIEKMINGRA